MFNIVIFGAPGSGKRHPKRQTDRRIRSLSHINREVLRDHIARGTELGKIADSYISQGQLIPDDLMIKVLEHVLDNTPEAEKE